MGTKKIKIADAVTIYIGNVLDGLSEMNDQSVHCCITSPPYFGLRDYGMDEQIGLEDTFQEFIEKLVAVFDEVWRVLRDDGTLWLNMGDSYLSQQGKGFNGNKRLDDESKNIKVNRPVQAGNIIGQPWQLAFALQSSGWILRQDIIWNKPNAMPESCQNRCTKSHEYLFLLTKQKNYFCDMYAIRERATEQPPGNKDAGKYQGDERHRTKQKMHLIEGSETKNKRSVWTIPTHSYKGAHFATFPPKLVEPCIKAGTSQKGVCPECEAPWNRQIEKIRKKTRPGKDTKVTGDSLVDGNRDPERHVTQYKTTGWEPGCDCGELKPVPATVLDPFLGSGTVVAVATQKGRHGVGCELNPDYAKLASKRIKQGIRKKGFGFG